MNRPIFFILSTIGHWAACYFVLIAPQAATDPRTKVLVISTIAGLLAGLTFRLAFGLLSDARAPHAFRTALCGTLLGTASALLLGLAFGIDPNGALIMYFGLIAYVVIFNLVVAAAIARTIPD